MVYCSTDDVKTHSKITYSDLWFADDAAYVTFLTGLIAQIQEVVDKFCNQPIAFFEAGGITQTDEYYDSDGSGDLYLNYRPVISASA